jgi:hypothetical protein
VPPATYVAFHYGGRLQAIHHVERTQIFTNPRESFPTAEENTVQLHYLFHLGPPIVPPHEVKNGPKVMMSGRRWCMIDTLLTCKTITEAYEETKRRLGSEADDAGEA